MIKNVKFSDVYERDLCRDAVINAEFEGFPLDYYLVHTLMRRYKPATIFEIGTNMGTGTKILKNACMDAAVFTLDLPTELAHQSLQSPLSEGKGDKVGRNCNLPFVQLRGDSMTFDYSKYPCEAYFIDGEHDYYHPYHETKEALKQNPKLIVWHDADIDAVRRAIIDATNLVIEKDYDLFFVTDTRIAYALKK